MRTRPRRPATFLLSFLSPAIVSLVVVMIVAYTKFQKDGTRTRAKPWLAKADTHYNHEKPGDLRTLIPNAALILIILPRLLLLLLLLLLLIIMIIFMIIDNHNINTTTTTTNNNNNNNDDNTDNNNDDDQLMITGYIYIYI